jgi:serine/threonine protein kinase
MTPGRFAADPVLATHKDQSRPRDANHYTFSLLALTPGTHLGVYEITAQIGEGGMGQVFRARDMKLDRQVAIKILPEAFAHDAERLARFQREAKTLASLNHPNIAAIYGLEESGGMTALVMELVEGDDLSQHCAWRDPARRSVARCQADRRGAGSGARARDHSPRSETCQHQGPE